jgi:hypothetical protein
MLLPLLHVSASFLRHLQGAHSYIFPCLFYFNFSIHDVSVNRFDQQQDHKNYFHENWPCGRLRCYRKTSVSLLTVEGLGNKH